MISCDLTIVSPLVKINVMGLPCAFIPGIGPSVMLHNIHPNLQKYNIWKVLVIHLHFRDKESYAVIMHVSRYR